MLLLAAALLATAGASAAADEQDGDNEARAAEVMTEGVELLEAGDAAGAEQRFRTVIELVPEKGAPYYFLARALADQDNCEEAIKHLEHYLSRSFERRFVQQTTELMQTCLEKIAEANRPPPPPQAEAPPPPIAAPVPQRRRQRTPPHRGMRIAGWASLGVGAVSMAVGIGYGLDARSLTDDINQRREAWTDEALLSLPEETRDRDRARDRAIVLTSIGGALLVTGTALYWFSRGSTKEVTVVPVATGDTAAVVVSGSF